MRGLLRPAGAEAFQPTGKLIGSLVKDLSKPREQVRSRRSPSALPDCRVCWLEPQYAAQSSVNVAHEGWWEMPRLGI